MPNENASTNIPARENGLYAANIENKKEMKFTINYYKTIYISLVYMLVSINILIIYLFIIIGKRHTDLV